MTYTPATGAPRAISIWWFAFGYFACYVPYSALTKALSGGRFESLGALPGLSLLPLSVAASTVGMLAFITAMGWWQYAGRRRIGQWSVPWPSRWTFLSGLCTAGIIATTTLAYTFEGLSIVFMMLLMRGGVLILAPIVDALSGRRVRWFSAVALLLSLAALVVGFVEKRGFAITLVAALDVGLYLAGYFVRLRFMSKLAKSEDTTERTRYFVEEQMIATPSLMILLVLGAVSGVESLGPLLAAGFTEIPGSDAAPLVVLIGLFSQGTGVFGGLILLSPQENSYCVPVNRASSILAGVLASWSLFFLFDGVRQPSSYEMLGASLVIAAIVMLSVPPLLARKPTR